VASVVSVDLPLAAVLSALSAQLDDGYLFTFKMIFKRYLLNLTSKMARPITQPSHQEIGITPITRSLQLHRASLFLLLTDDSEEEQPHHHTSPHIS
jgi:hypothetical protein